MPRRFRDAGEMADWVRNERDLRHAPTGNHRVVTTGMTINYQDMDGQHRPVMQVAAMALNGIDYHELDKGHVSTDFELIDPYRDHPRFQILSSAITKAANTARFR